MDVITVTAHSAGDFRSLMNEEAARRVGKEGIYTLGAVDLSDLLGCIQFRYIMSENEKELLAEILYVFVEEGHRGEGVGSVLMSFVKKLAGQGGAACLVMSLSGHEEMGFFAEAHDFILQETEELVLEPVFSSYVIQNKFQKDRGIRPLSSLPPADFRGLMRRLGDESSMEGGSHSYGNCDPELSCYFDKSDEKYGVLLFSKGDRIKRMCQLKVSDVRLREYILSLLLYAIGAGRDENCILVLPDSSGEIMEYLNMLSSDIRVTPGVMGILDLHVREEVREEGLDMEGNYGTETSEPGNPGI